MVKTLRLFLICLLAGVLVLAGLGQWRTFNIQVRTLSVSAQGAGLMVYKSPLVLYWDAGIVARNHREPWTNYIKPPTLSIHGIRDPFWIHVPWWVCLAAIGGGLYGLRWLERHDRSKGFEVEVAADRDAGRK